MPDQTQEIDAHVAEDCAKAPLNGRWVFKLLVITLVVFIVGAWGLWDASTVYPNRGERYAKWAKWQYLDQAKKADTEDFGIFVRESSVTDPKQELARLLDEESVRRNLQDAENTMSPRTLRASMLNTRLAWLKGLKVVGQLDPDHTTFASPQRELDDLAMDWQSEPPPKPLHNLDLVVQWIIMGACWLISLWMVIHMLKVRAMRFAWKSDSMTLILPSGDSITPDDLEEVDKRKWDKFIVFLKIKPSHETLGGKEISVDTYQHNFVEDWILAMEEKAFGSQEDEDETDSEPQSDVPTDTPDDTSDDAPDDTAKPQDEPEG